MQYMTAQSSTGENLCQACREVFDRAAFPPFHSVHNEHHRELASLKEAVRQGCFICSWLWLTITDHGEYRSWKYNMSRSFTCYGISNTKKAAPFHVQAIDTFHDGEIKRWRPGDGLLPGAVPDPAGRWLLSFYFYDLGFANDWNIAKIVEECEVTFVLEPVESE